ncbi:MAG: amidohydrolase [Acidisphaera sp.]|nr:amidohydrolase [Acidisphaera sp.]
MSEVLDRTTSVAQKLRIIDSDIHPSMKTPRDLHPFLSERWRKHVSEYGKPGHRAYHARGTYPRFMPNTARRDAWPSNGLPPGADLDFMREQLLDRYNIEVGILEPLFDAQLVRNSDLAAALCSAVNDWQVETFTNHEPRLRASIQVAFEDAPAAVGEIDRRVTDLRYAQIQLTSGSTEPIGRKRYWPVFEAAEHYGLPIGMHIGGDGGHAPSASGWPSFYVEDHHRLVHTMQCQVTSMILEGVFERFPGLKVICIEGGLAWAPSLAWRLDRHWEKMRGEVPECREKPSFYMRRNVWFSTQPMEEPERPDDLRRIFDAIGWDHILYASDYPHWDFDDPYQAFPCRLSPAEQHAILHGNAEKVYRLA